MGLNLNLFVHGVPKGQKIWGPQEDDHIYIESFYGRNSNVEVQLLVEVIQINGNVNCYFTYFRNGSICDKDNRAGAYFALTVRSNAYYADLANMYNILDAAYHKFILGTIINSDVSATKFIVEDFNQVDKQLQDVKKEILHYIGSFSVDSDIVDLRGFKVNSEQNVEIINLLECNNKSLLDYVKTKGNLSVSPLHPTKEVEELTKRMNEEIESIKSQSQQQISMVQNEAGKRIKEASEGNEKAIEAIKREFSFADKTISGLKQQLEKEKSNVSILENEVIIYKENLKTYENIKKELAKKEKEFDKANQIFSEVKQSVSAWNENPVPKGGSNKNPQDPIKIKKTVLEKLNKFHPLVNLIVMLILILVITFSLLKSPSFDKTLIEELNNAKVQIEQLGNKLEQTEKQLTQQSIESTAEPDILNSSSNNSEDPNAKIDITEFNSKIQNMNMGESYHISIKNVDVNGGWKSSDFIFNDDKTITPLKTGDCTIYYIFKNKVIKSRTINVVN